MTFSDLAMYAVFFEMQTMKLFIVPEATFKVHSKLSVVSSFIRSPYLLPETAKIAEMTLKVDQGHWRRQFYRPHITFCQWPIITVTVLYHLSDS